MERYGTDEVNTWLWELWNEPDIFYWRGTPEQFHELYRVTVEGVRSVLPTAKVGGPAVTGAAAAPPAGPRATPPAGGRVGVRSRRGPAYDVARQQPRAGPR